MKKVDHLVTATVSILMLLSTNSVYASGSVAATADNEKCYGIVKKGMNDCNTSTQSCAGSSTIDKQKDAFIFLPKGVCHKIVDGSTTPEAGPALKPNDDATKPALPEPSSTSNQQSMRDTELPEEERD